MRSRGGTLVKSTSAPRSAITYCIVPSELAEALHEPLRKHFADDPSAQVVVERRGDERRGQRDRRACTTPVANDRRLIRSDEGRRVADRRALAAETEGLPLPRRLVRYETALRFVERLEPSTELLEDRDTIRLVTRFQAGERQLFSEI